MLTLSIFKKAIPAKDLPAIQFQEDVRVRAIGLSVHRIRKVENKNLQGIHNSEFLRTYLGNLLLLPI